MRLSSLRIFHIGIDDTDSADGMCTTFLTYNLVRYLSRLPGFVRLIDYPNLIRLNPNIPWKTRGNAALALHIETDLSRSKLFEICREHVDRFATSKKANAGLVLHEGEVVPQSVCDFARRALTSVLSIREAKDLIERTGMSCHGLRAQQGLVGALAAIGNQLKKDFTFELIAYRSKTQIVRKVDKSKVVRMSRMTAPATFNSYDEENDRVLIVPHGLDPVLLGIRGETPSAVRSAFRLLGPIENLLGYMIFRSNQGTGEHLEALLDLGNVRAYHSGKVVGTIQSTPKAQMGGHVFFELANEEGSITCACYEPTGKLRNSALSLIEGDLVEIGGGVRKSTSKHPKVLNVEYILPVTLADHEVLHNPKCTTCNISMSSEGRSQGFRCPKCNAKSPYQSKTRTLVPRAIIAGRVYLPDLNAHRHLSKPLQRLLLRTHGRFQNRNLIKNWISAG